MKLLSDLRTDTRKKWRISPFGWSIESNLDAESLQFMIVKWVGRTKAQTQRSLINFLNLYSHLGIQAGRPLNELPPGHIRRNPGISNSKLTRLKYELQGKPLTFPQRCLVFGQAFHAVVLEHKRMEDPEWNLRPSEWMAIGQMRDSYIAEMGSYLIEKEKARRPKFEQPIFWKDAETGLPCKALLDINTPRTVFDVKTTASATPEHFTELLPAYDYDRQAAFYLDGSPSAERFCFVAVQKRPPYAVHIVPFHRDSDFIRRGREKYRFLLKKWQEKHGG